MMTSKLDLSCFLFTSQWGMNPRQGIGTHTAPEVNRLSIACQWGMNPRQESVTEIGDGVRAASWRPVFLGEETVAVGFAAVNGSGTTAWWGGTGEASRRAAPGAQGCAW